MYTGGQPPKMPSRATPVPTPQQHDKPVQGGIGMPKAGSGDSEQDTKKKEQSSLLFDAAGKNDLNAVKQALGEGGDANICDLQGVSALLLAIKNKNTAMISLLLSSKASPNNASQDNSPIHESIRQHNPQLLEQLLNAGGDINLRADFGKTPLHVAIQEDQWNIVDILLKKKADLNAVTDSGVTCLHFGAAISTGSAASKDGVEKLINLMKQVDLVNKNGKTPLHVAAEKGNLDAIKLLLMANASTTIKDGWGRTPSECGKATAFKLISNHKPGTKYEFVDMNALAKEIEKEEKEAAKK
jgi:ankyrin repeat protein